MTAARPLLALSAACWLVLLASDFHLIVPHLCAAGGVPWDALPGTVPLALRLNPVAPMIAHWLLMLGAMMLPLLPMPRPSAAFLLCYGAMWIAAIALLTLAVAIVRLVGPSDMRAVACLAIGVALAWQGTACKIRGLNHCHAGTEQDGVRYAAAGVCACWALMALPLVIDLPHPWGMIAVTLVMLAERRRAPRPARADPRLLWLGSATAVLGVIFV